MFKVRQPAHTARSNPRSYHATFLTSKDMERPTGGSAAARCCLLLLLLLLLPFPNLPTPPPTVSDPTHLLAAAVPQLPAAARARSTRGT